jgi:hypothetical protein
MFIIVESRTSMTIMYEVFPGVSELAALEVAM